MNEEIYYIKKDGIQDLVELLKHKQTINCKWVYKTKFYFNGILKHQKARLVVNDFKQKEGINYEETFAPVANMNTIKLILALTAQCKCQFIRWM